jgi:hypothetical protein
MKVRMDKVLKRWVRYDMKNHPDRGKVSRSELLTRVLQYWEEEGDAMRRLDKKGRICWRIAPEKRRQLRYVSPL